MPNRKREAVREKEYDTRRAIWDRQKAERLVSNRTRYGRAIVSFDAYGKPMGQDDVTSEDVAWRDVCLGLERALNATGDPIFSDALECLKDYGLAGDSPKHSYEMAQAAVFGDNDLRYLQNMKWVLDRRFQGIDSITSAAQDIAAHYFYDAPNFDRAVEKLRKLYSKWARSDFALLPTKEQGDAGYAVHVKPVGEHRVPMPYAGLQLLPSEGATVRYTSYWRRRFADGDVAIAKPQ